MGGLVRRMLIGSHRVCIPSSNHYHEASCLPEDFYGRSQYMSLVLSRNPGKCSGTVLGLTSCRPRCYIVQVLFFLVFLFPFRFLIDTSAEGPACHRYIPFLCPRFSVLRLRSVLNALLCFITY